MSRSTFGLALGGLFAAASLFGAPVPDSVLHILRGLLWSAVLVGSVLWISARMPITRTTQRRVQRERPWLFWTPVALTTALLAAGIHNLSVRVEASKQSNEFNVEKLATAMRAQVKPQIYAECEATNPPSGGLFYWTALYRWDIPNQPEDLVLPSNGAYVGWGLEPGSDFASAARCLFTNHGDNTVFNLALEVKTIFFDVAEYSRQSDPDKRVALGSRLRLLRIPRIEANAQAVPLYLINKGQNVINITLPPDAQGNVSGQGDRAVEIVTNGGPYPYHRRVDIHPAREASAK